MLAVYIRVHLNILGGYMYQDTLNGYHGVVIIRFHSLQNFCRIYVSSFEFVSISAKMGNWSRVYYFGLLTSHPGQHNMHDLGKR